MSERPHFFTEPHRLSGFCPASPILLGLSGGADSSALLHLLSDYGRVHGCRIVAAHINHGIRGEKYGFEADRDERFCREICDMLNIELFVKKVDIPAMSHLSGKSYETEARDARYAFFAEVMKAQNIMILATAHNADDNLETQLYNLARGCGIDGMVGIPQKRSFDSIRGAVVIRPILKAEKKDILNFCARENISYVNDCTNSEKDCVRNIIRHDMIPSLAALFPSVRRSALRLSSNAAEDSDYITGEARKFVDGYINGIPADAFRSLHPSVQKRALKLAFKKISDATLEYIHICDIISIVNSQKNGASVSLPGKKQACVTDGILAFSDDKKAIVREVSAYNQALNEGMNIIGNTGFAVMISSVPLTDDSVDELHDKYTLYSSAILFITDMRSIYAKNRTPGACILDGGMSKKIKKLMCDKKVPLHDRDILPILYSEDTAVYVPLCSVSDSSKHGHEGQRIHISIFRKKTEDHHE